MPPNHHPSHYLLTNYASGTISSGLFLGVTTHLHHCAECRARVAIQEEIGGGLLRDIGAEQHENFIPFQQFQKKLAGDFGREQKVVSDVFSLVNIKKEDMQKKGFWEKLMPGISQHQLYKNGSEKIKLMKIDSSTAVPMHTHDGVETTIILDGSFSDSLGTYHVGDFVSHHDDVNHQPMVGAEKACICLVIMDGSLRLTSVMGRLINPFLQF
ncbi:MAG: ChrR family anti-sigma-E factor [Alphaproteobacteria bacterium]